MLNLYKPWDFPDSTGLRPGSCGDAKPISTDISPAENQQKRVFLNEINGYPPPILYGFCGKYHVQKLDPKYVPVAWGGLGCLNVGDVKIGQ